MFKNYEFLITTLINFKNVALIFPSKKILKNQHGKKITLFYYKKATKFTEPNSNSFSWTAESEFPGQFHDYLVAKAIALGYEKKPNQLDVATYFHSKFEKGVREGRNYAYRARAGTVKYIKPVDF